MPWWPGHRSPTNGNMPCGAARRLMMSIRPLVALALAIGTGACALQRGGGGLLRADVAVPDSFLVTFVTSRGRFDVLARTQWSPSGVDRFYQLVNDRYYDGAAFFRVIKGF